MSENPETNTPATPAGAGGRARRTGREAASWALTLAIGLAAAAGLRAFIAESFFVPSGSMENTLAIGDRIIAEKASAHWNGYQRGDVIVFNDPQNWIDTAEASPSPLAQALHIVGIAPDPSEQQLVKRIVGISGDRVQCCSPDGNLIINGHEVDESAYTHSRSDQIAFDLTVPAGHVFVLGDNRDNSADSRFHQDQNGGFVATADIIGKAAFIAWPPAHAGTVPGSGALAGVAAAGQGTSGAGS